jgi:hypothetical protein
MLRQSTTPEHHPSHRLSAAIPPSGSPFFRFVQDHPDVLPALPGYIHEALVRRYIQNANHRGLRDEDLDALVVSYLGRFSRSTVSCGEHDLGVSDVSHERLHQSLSDEPPHFLRLYTTARLVTHDTWHR